jgi:hypothetical protein
MDIMPQLAFETKRKTLPLMNADNADRKRKTINRLGKTQYLGDTEERRKRREIAVIAVIARNRRNRKSKTLPLMNADDNDRKS